ncbi:hypothetical protein CRUP_007234, partial [Coryphaenoides rupestris]
ALRGVVGELRLVSSSCLSPGGDRRAARQAVPSQRVRELASAKQRGALFRASDDPGDPRGRHDRRVVSASALLAKPSPRLQELALPLARKWPLMGDLVWGPLLLALGTLGKCDWATVARGPPPPGPPPGPPPAPPPGPPPRLLGCVFFQRGNVTCHWEAGVPPHAPPNAPPPAARYTLVVEKMRRSVNPSLVAIETFGCSTDGTSCMADLRRSNVAFVFCVSVLEAQAGPGQAGPGQAGPGQAGPGQAGPGQVGPGQAGPGQAGPGQAGPGRWRRSPSRCQSGRKEVMLAPVTLLRVSPVTGQPRCLLLEWDRPMSYAVSPSEINGGNLTSQIEFFTQEQPAKEQSYVRARTGSFQACVFSPATWYSVRLRHRYRASSAPWSLWSPPCSGRTAEDDDRLG